MRRATAALVAGVFAVLLSACGTNNITDDFFTPTVPAPVPATATPTVAPPTPTATSTPSAPPTPLLLFSADPMDAANPFPGHRLLDASGHAVALASYLDPGLPPTPLYDKARAYVQNAIGQLHALTGFPTFAPVVIRFETR